MLWLHASGWRAGQGLAPQGPWHGHCPSCDRQEALKGRWGLKKGNLEGCRKQVHLLVQAASSPPSTQHPALPRPSSDKKRSDLSFQPTLAPCSSRFCTPLGAALLSVLCAGL